MYIYIYICMYVCMDGWMYGWMDVCLYKYICMYVCPPFIIRYDVDCSLNQKDPSTQVVLARNRQSTLSTVYKSYLTY